MKKEFEKNDAVRIKPKFANVVNPGTSHNLSYRTYNPYCFWFIFNVKGDTCTIYSIETKCVGGTRREYLKNIKLDWIKDAGKEYNNWIDRLSKPRG